MQEPIVIAPSPDLSPEGLYQQATLLSRLGLTVPVHAGELLVGTWQQTIHLECDIRPRQRTIVVTVLGE
jgi:thiamine phosphate synthase YjbQ (UPF0047 family)